MKNSTTNQRSEKSNNEADNHSTPRWVKVLGVILISLVLVVVIIMLFSGGKHGPGRHLNQLDDSVGYLPPNLMKVIDSYQYDNSIA